MKPGTIKRLRCLNTDGRLVCINTLQQDCVKQGVLEVGEEKRKEDVFECGGIIITHTHAHTQDKTVRLQIHQCVQ